MLTRRSCQKSSMPCLLRRAALELAQKLLIHRLWSSDRITSRADSTAGGPFMCLHAPEAPSCLRFPPTRLRISLVCFRVTKGEVLACDARLKPLGLSCAAASCRSWVSVAANAPCPCCGFFRWRSFEESCFITSPIGPRTLDITDVNVNDTQIDSRAKLLQPWSRMHRF